MHPILGEIARVKTGEVVRPDVIRRWQQAIVHEVQPLLDERDRLIDENASLREQLAAKGSRKAVTA